MTGTGTVLTIAIALALLVLVTLVVVSRPPKRPCYRCGGLSRCEYMALHYCWICRDVVSRMFPIVDMGGMFGFPGAPGHLEFPVDEKKKEV